MNKLKNELEYIKIRNKISLDLDNLATDKGYTKVEPDYFESYDWISKTNTRINPKSMVKIIDPSGEVLLLRPDITTNIIKQLSPYWESDSIFKMYYNSTTFRQKKSSITQTKQFGIEYIGDSTNSSENEIVKTVIEIFNRFGSSFILSIGNQKLLDQLLVNFNKEEIKLIKKAISKRDQYTLMSLVAAKDYEILESIFTLNGKIDEVLTKLSSLKDSELVLKYKDFLNNLSNSLNEEELEIIDIDLALLPEFDYYSGIVFQGYLKGLSKPILSGGRYDKLTKEYGSEIPAVGASFDLTAYIKEVTNG